MFSRDKEYNVECTQCESYFTISTESVDVVQFCCFCGTMLSDNDVESDED